VQQFVKENYLRWDSLGEFLALAVSIEELGEKTGNAKARTLGAALDWANGQVLENDKSPQRKIGEIDNRGSHFYLAFYWAQALATQAENAELRAKFLPIAAALRESETRIVAELNGVQGTPVDLGGYYFPDANATARAMRPSATFNGILDAIA
jgi:isocitrate dehydrogenase